LLRGKHAEFIRQRKTTTQHTNSEIAVWSRSQEVVIQLGFPAELVPYYNAVDGIDVVQGIHPPLQFLSERTVLASLSERYGTLTLAFQLPDKPFTVEERWEWRAQHFVVSVRNRLADADDKNTFWTPYLPQLNEWYGRNLFQRGRAARAEIDGLGIICPITDESLELRSIPKQELATKLFEQAGINAKPSLPGRIASRLISQLGGLQGCRVLKIAGVRHLIKKYGPLEHFDRTEAMRIIGNCDPVSGQPRFSYEDLFMEGCQTKARNYFPLLAGQRCVPRWAGSKLSGV
jgi:hypothetical protein